MSPKEKQATAKLAFAFSGRINEHFPIPLKRKTNYLFICYNSTIF